MGLELSLDNQRIGLENFEECPSDEQRLRGTSYCAFYNTNKCERREECQYYKKKQAEKASKEKN